MPQVDLNHLRTRALLLAQQLRHCKPTVHYAAIAVVVGFLISFIPYLFDFFSLKPSDFFNFQLWKLFTACFVEPNLLMVIFEVYVAYELFHVIEPVWGHVELFKYIAVVQLMTPVFIAFLAILRFALFLSFDYYYFGILNGFGPLAGATLVVIKQFLPDTVLLPTPFGRVKNMHIPAISVGIAIVFWILGLLRGTVALQLAFGVQIGWTYLRFFQLQHDTKESGDRSEQFAWATLFPRKSQPYAHLLGRMIYRSLAKVGICKHVEYTGFENYEPVNMILPTDETRDADRRRQKALLDLNERLRKKEKSATPERSPTAPTDDPTLEVPAAYGSAQDVIIQVDN